MSALPLCSAWLSLLFLLLAAALAGRRDVSPRSLIRRLRLAVIVPAHNEELVLAGTLEACGAQNYPADRFEIVVVADNCTDQTAALARAHGVTVLERFHATERGKGLCAESCHRASAPTPQSAGRHCYCGCGYLGRPGFSVPHGSDGWLSAQDPRGFGAWQGRYGVLNAGDGWRAALMAGAFDLVNHVKPLGREALGLSVGLKGNGMAFTRALAADLPWPGGSLTEDLDYGLELARRYDLRVGYAPEARVLAQMPASAEQAASQRARWEGGRLALGAAARTASLSRRPAPPEPASSRPGLGFADAAACGTGRAGGRLCPCSLPPVSRRICCHILPSGWLPPSYA